MSPLDLGGDADDDAPADTRREGRQPQDGWKALWRRVQAHKDRQALERKAAKQVHIFTVDMLLVAVNSRGGV